MKRNVGIARRLFPLLDNDRRVAELFHALLFSLPGSPVLYYGDEIGMGDNIYLGDRDGVRTPMQWSARPQRRVLRGRLRPALPAAADGPGLRLRGASTSRRGLRDPSSFLHWLQRMIQVRRKHPVFGTGDLRAARRREPVGDGLPAQARHRDGTALPGTATTDVVLCVNNLSRFAQPAEIVLTPLRRERARRDDRPRAVPADR